MSKEDDHWFRGRRRLPEAARGCRRLVHCTLSLGPSHPFPRCQISGFRNNPWGSSYRTLRGPRLLKLQVSVREAIPSPGLPSSMGPESQSVRSISKHDLVVHHHTDPLDALLQCCPSISHGWQKGPRLASGQRELSRVVTTFWAGPWIVTGGPPWGPTCHTLVCIYKARATAADVQAS